MAEEREGSLLCHKRVTPAFRPCDGQSAIGHIGDGDPRNWSRSDYFPGVTRSNCPRALAEPFEFVGGVTLLSVTRGHSCCPAACLLLASFTGGQFYVENKTAKRLELVYVLVKARDKRSGMLFCWDRDNRTLMWLCDGLSHVFENQGKCHT